MGLFKKTLKKNKNKTKSNTKKINRKLLGQGSYGCVYKPGFKCSIANNNNNDIISKVMENNNANDELKNFILIDKIDPEAIFHIKLEGACDLSSNNRNNIIKKGNCDVVDYYTKYKNLKFKDGGKELYYYYDIISKLGQLSKNANFNKILKNNGKIAIGENNEIMKVSDVIQNYGNINMVYKLVISYKNIIDGLKVLNKAKYSHFDIKLENIVYDINKDVMKLIDFGVSLSYNYKIKKDDINNAFNIFEDYEPFFLSYYEVYPFELILCDYNNFNFTLSYYNRPDKIMNKLRKSIRDYDEEEQEFNYMIHNKSILKYYIKLLTKLLKRYKNNKLAYIAYLRLVFDKVDLFSCGIVLSKIIEKYYSLFKRVNESTDLITSNQYTEFKSIYKMVNKWVDNVTNPILTKRLTVKKAVDEYSKIYEYCLNKIIE